MRKLLSAWALTLALATSASAGDSVRELTVGPLSVTASEKRLRLAVATEYVLFTQTGSAIVGLVLAGDVQYALSRKWAFGGGIRQAFSSSGFSGIFTQIHMSVARSLTGTLLSSDRQVSLKESPVARSIESDPHGWAARFYLSQYFINTTGLILPFTGIGAGVSYDWQWGEKTPVSLGLRIDRMTNGTSVYHPISCFAAIGLWL